MCGLQRRTFGRSRAISFGVLVLGGLLSGTQALSQSNIHPTNKFSWGENIGWTNWRDANGGADGVLVGATHLSGFTWGENVGWINVGDGSPTDGNQYANTDGSDFGVNVDANGDLFGFAWGENIGWVNFDTRSKGAERARLDLVAQRFRGYAWGENVGWINLDDSTHFVEFGGLSGRQLPGDCNQDGDLDLSDAVCTLGVLFTGNPPTFPCGDGSLTDPGTILLIDWQPDGAVDLSDAVAALTFIFSGGPAHTLAVPGMETSACVLMAGCPDNSNCP